MGVEDLEGTQDGSGTEGEDRAPALWIPFMLMPISMPNSGFLDGIGTTRSYSYL